MRQFIISTKIVALVLCCILGSLTVITSMCFVNVHRELGRIVAQTQETRMHVFRDLLENKGDAFRIVEGKLLAGDYLINGNHELPDKIKEFFGGTATIFMGDVCVATTIMAADGTRALGTRLEETAYDAVFRENRSYRGKTIISGEHYVTAYDPLRNERGEVVGVLSTGIKRSDFSAGFDRRLIQIVFIAAGLAILVGVGAFMLLRRILINPVRSMVEGLRTIASGRGDLTMRIDIVRSDEIGFLARLFNRFIGNLESIIARVQSCAMVVDTATSEVATGIQGLSHATQEQASAIEEVAATIEEMNSSIKNNAMHAENGKNQGKEMVTMANASGEASRELMQAMGEISDASMKIGEIIGTVNEVAFQTNLLALNAAVEAARAGEHGKGFSVVADEVRSLAQKSAAAARQIKELIEDTVHKVRAGDEIVQKSAQLLELIIEKITVFSQTMEEIAISSVEQATGVDEVNRAISQIDITTQENASTVEELASTSDNLRMEARELTAIVERFKVSGYVVKPSVSRRLSEDEGSVRGKAGEKTPARENQPDTPALDGREEG
ncbi:MAG TPA: methyl-accepting chemotaxis protein [Deltaproteobacteria bacterium]|nr:methyl-accepting chemotaxis protein [Deltaproteobacteria bacterium]